MQQKAPEPALMMKSPCAVFSADGKLSATLEKRGGAFALVLAETGPENFDSPLAIRFENWLAATFPENTFSRITETSYVDGAGEDGIPMDSCNAVAVADAQTLFYDVLPLLAGAFGAGGYARLQGALRPFVPNCLGVRIVERPTQCVMPPGGYFQPHA